MSRYSLEFTGDAIMLFDYDEKVMMPITLDQIAILLNVQDDKIKRLEGDIDD